MCVYSAVVLNDRCPRIPSKNRAAHRVYKSTASAGRLENLPYVTHGSIAVLQRTIRTRKELLPKFGSIPYRRDEMRQLIRALVGWYNEHRPHTTLKGAAPNEIYFKRFPANRKPRIEPRPHWPRGSPCARPHALVGGNPGARFNIEVEHVDGQAQLPIIRLRRAA